jgi:hypothetical protein
LYTCPIDAAAILSLEISEKTSLNDNPKSSLNIFSASSLEKEGT